MDLPKRLYEKSVQNAGTLILTFMLNGWNPDSYVGGNPFHTTSKGDLPFNGIAHWRERAPIQKLKHIRLGLSVHVQQMYGETNHREEVL